MTYSFGDSLLVAQTRERGSVPNLYLKVVGATPPEAYVTVDPDGNRSVEDTPAQHVGQMVAFSDQGAYISARVFVVVQEGAQLVWRPKI